MEQDIKTLLAVSTSSLVPFETVLHKIHALNTLSGFSNASIFPELVHHDGDTRTRTDGQYNNAPANVEVNTTVRNPFTVVHQKALLSEFARYENDSAYGNELNVKSFHGALDPQSIMHSCSSIHRSSYSASLT